VGPDYHDGPAPWRRPLCRGIRVRCKGKCKGKGEDGKEVAVPCTFVVDLAPTSQGSKLFRLRNGLPSLNLKHSCSAASALPSPKQGALLLFAVLGVDAIPDLNTVSIAERCETFLKTFPAFKAQADGKQRHRWNKARPFVEKMREVLQKLQEVLHQQQGHMEQQLGAKIKSNTLLLGSPRRRTRTLQRPSDPAACTRLGMLCWG